MITAHLPAGYCLASLSCRHRPQLMAAALFGSILPDLDLIWFYLVDDRAIHHHRYWLHAPGFWLALLLPAWLAGRRRAVGPVIAVLGAAVAVHLILDTIAGGIMWGFPLDSDLYRLVTVPATPHHWIITYLIHWTFLLELAIWMSAVVLWSARRPRWRRKWSDPGNGMERGK